MPRKRRPFVREDVLRDARLIVIATEDTNASVAYFKALTSPAYYQSSKVHVEVLNRQETASSPRHILEQIKQWKTEYQFDEDDEFWLVIDVDNWGDAGLSRVVQECTQQSIRLAISNPAIELWFLLHLTNFQYLDKDIQEDLTKRKSPKSGRTRLEHAIINIIGSYNKSNLRVDDYLPHVMDAIERAKQLDVNPQDRWPQKPGTRVYLLVQTIIDTASHGRK